MKISKDSSARYYQKNKEWLQKSLWKVSRSWKKKKQIRNNMVAKDIKTFLNMESKGYWSIEKYIIKYGEKTVCK